MVSNLIGALIGLARATEGNEELITNSTTSILIKALNNINNNEPDVISVLLEEIEIEKKKLIPLCYDCKTKCGRNDPYNFMKIINNSNDEVSAIKLKILDELTNIASLNKTDDYTISLLFNSLFLLGIDNINKDYLSPTLIKLKKYKN